MHKQLQAVMRGRVQGVGFRATTVDEARRRALAGWVRNLSDGAVEVLAQGDESVLEEFLAFLKTGPRTAHVANVVTTWADPADAPFPFEVRKTP